MPQVDRLGQRPNRSKGNPSTASPRSQATQTGQQETLHRYPNRSVMAFSKPATQTALAPKQVKKIPYTGTQTALSRPLANPPPKQPWHPNRSKRTPQRCPNSLATPQVDRLATGTHRPQVEVLPQGPCPTKRYCLKPYTPEAVPIETLYPGNNSEKKNFPTQRYYLKPCTPETDPKKTLPGTKKNSPLFMKHLFACHRFSLRHILPAHTVYCRSSTCGLLQQV